MREARGYGRVHRADKRTWRWMGEEAESAATQRRRGPLRAGERERWRVVTGKQASARGRTGELVQMLDEDEEVPGPGGRAPRGEWR